MNLYDAEIFIDEYTYQNILNECISIGGNPEYTIVGVQVERINITKGPMVAEWNQKLIYTDTLIVTPQSTPFYFNGWCPPNGPANHLGNYQVGCVAVAVGQVMNYHKRPQSNFIPTNHPKANLFHPTPGWSKVFNWNNMIVDPQYQTTSSVPILLRAVGEAVYMGYGQYASLSHIDNAQNALKNIYGYTTVTKADHNFNTVRTNLLANRPVLMSGYPNTGDGHVWVCDGLKYEQYQTEFFVEYYTGSGSYVRYGYVPDDPGISIKDGPYTDYHMNWGEFSYPNGWFFGRVHNPSPGLAYKYGRQNLYIIP